MTAQRDSDTPGKSGCADCGGPLAGIKIVELAGIGPNPMCGMLLAELGAEVVRVDRVQPTELGISVPTRFALVHRSRRSVAVDLKQPAGVDVVLRLVERADALIEGYRPGVAERLGLGPDHCQARNPRLVYGRITGWGQTGALAHAAGHDLNYVALAGAAHGIGRKNAPPPPPLNLIADGGGGALYLALGVVAALLEAQRSGQGQIVDAGMTDGVASLMTGIYGLRAAGLFSDRRESNFLDGGAPYYDIYETADGKFISVAAIEPKFYAQLVELAGLDDADLQARDDVARWPELDQKMRALFKTKTRAEWCARLEGTDACFAPVLTMDEAPQHRHNAERGTFVDVDGVTQPAPAPRFSRTPSRIQGPPRKPGADTDTVLAAWGFDGDEIAQLRQRQVIA